MSKILRENQLEKYPYQPYMKFSKEDFAIGDIVYLNSGGALKIIDHDYSDMDDCFIMCPVNEKFDWENSIPASCVQSIKGNALRLYIGNNTVFSLN